MFLTLSYKYRLTFILDVTWHCCGWCFSIAEFEFWHRVHCGNG